uniref:olfactory receptor 4D11-like n=1 Tax=Epinephelus lanceolatus TaxID=310571 RepID=UPI001446FD06|nr:olfactory receptor 4D11-like [Epinephelus lanceolatus]
MEQSPFHCKRKLHKPMYLLICNLAVVDIVYTSSASSTMIGVLLAGVKTISYVPCLIQMFVFHWGGVMEMFALAKMGSTCLSHLIVVTSYYCPLFITIVLTRLGVVLTLDARQGLTLGAMLGPSLLNPLVYCLRTKEIRCKLFKVFKKDLTSQ